MNECTDDRKWCHFHPRELVVGVCALCLNERLLVLASKQSHLRSNNTDYSVIPKRVLPKIFALTSLLGRSDIKQQKSEVYHSSSTSQEDSFISIKFEDNGGASWDKEKISKMHHDQQCDLSWDESSDQDKKMKSVVEHAKARTTLRWRRRIGHLFRVGGWKRSRKGNTCQVGTKLEGGKVKYGWISTLTKRTRE